MGKNEKKLSEDQIESNKEIEQKMKKSIFSAHTMNGSMEIQVKGITEDGFLLCTYVGFAGYP